VWCVCACVWCVCVVCVCLCVCVRVCVVCACVCVVCVRVCVVCVCVCVVCVCMCVCVHVCVNLLREPETSRSGCFIPLERTSDTHLMRSCVDPRAGFDTSDMKISLAPAWILFQSVANSLHSRSSPGNVQATFVLLRLLYLVNIRNWQYEVTDSEVSNHWWLICLASHIPTGGGKKFRWLMSWQVRCSHDPTNAYKWQIFIKYINLTQCGLFTHSCTSMELYDINKQSEFMKNCNGSLISIKRWKFLDWLKIKSVPLQAQRCPEDSRNLTLWSLTTTIVVVPHP